MDTMQTLRERRTIRLFEQRAVADQDLRAIIDCGRLASSAANLQPLRYIVIRTQPLVNKVLAETAWAGLVAPRRTPIADQTGPAAFIALLAADDAKPTTYADAGAALQNMQNAAWALGLGCCWIGSIKRDKLQQMLALPAGQQVLYLLAVGYPAEQPTAEDVAGSESVAYYLDDQNRLHVPKIKVEDLTDWR